MKAALLLTVLLFTAGAVALTWDSLTDPGQFPRPPLSRHHWLILLGVACFDVLVLSSLGKSDEVAE